MQKIADLDATMYGLTHNFNEKEKDSGKELTDAKKSELASQEEHYRAWLNRKETALASHLSVQNAIQ